MVYELTFRRKYQLHTQACRVHDGFFLALVIDLKAGGDMLRNVG
jgi:hypothetical protein